MKICKNCSHFSPLSIGYCVIGYKMGKTKLTKICICLRNVNENAEHFTGKFRFDWMINNFEC